MLNLVHISLLIQIRRLFTGESNIMDRELIMKQWIEVKNVVLMDLFIANMQFLEWCGLL